MKVTLNMIVDAVEQDDNIGFCVKCGHEAWAVEPDAQRVICEDCGERAVFGAEQLLLMNVA